MRRRGQLIEVERDIETEKMIEILTDNRRSPSDNQIRYQDGKRWVADWSEVETAREEARVPWQERGIYLISGGAGGLGRIVSQEIAQRVNGATVILTGRTPLNEKKQVQLKELQATGLRVEYRQVDVTHKEAVTSLLQSILEEFGSLNGIIHGAGVIRDNFILKKTTQELKEVLGPKVLGLVNLDEASKDFNLNFFLIFSSIAGSLGNLGQADYSSANAFMDAYAKYRNGLVTSKQRQGQTLSINWPLWQAGGMLVSQETQELMQQSTGMSAMQTSTGIRALYQALAIGKDQVMVMEGNVARMKQKLFR